MHTCKFSPHKNKKLFRNEGSQTKNKATRATKMEAKKVNNMPNLQSMSQAKGYGRLYKKSSQNALCSRETDRKSLLIQRRICFRIPSLELKLILLIANGSESGIVRTLGSSDNRFLSFFLISHVASQSWTICDTCVGFGLLHNNDCLFKVSDIVFTFV